MENIEDQEQLITSQDNTSRKRRTISKNVSGKLDLLYLYTLSGGIVFGQGSDSRVLIRF